jgi:REP element-mobilizing transposase RayT
MSKSAGFSEIDPWTSHNVSLRRRNLPHIEAAGATYFVTFRSKIILPPTARDVVLAEIVSCERKSIDLDAAVVMPDHVHMIFRLLTNENLRDVIRLIKGRSARSINELLMREGHLWIEESFDHVIRYEGELVEKLAYVKQKSSQARVGETSGRVQVVGLQTLIFVAQT